MDKKKKLVVVGVITALILSSSSVYADNDMKNYYRFVARAEMRDVSPQEKIDLIREVLENNVKSGCLTEEEAKLEQSKLAEDLLIES